MAQASANQSSARKPGQRSWTGYLFILPGFLIYAYFVFYPILQTLRFSLMEWNGFTPPKFIGLKNYLELFNDPLFLTGLRNNLLLIAFYTLLPITFALLLTAIMTRRKLAGLSFFRAGLFVPYVMSMVVVGVVWRWIYQPAIGPLNQILRAIGLDAVARPWLGDFQFALPAVGFIGTWVQYGFCMVLFIAGVQHIGEELYDAAKIDGANGWNQFLNVTLPGLRSEISIAMVATFISALRVFDLIWVTTRGGPGTNTMVTSLWLYRNAFVNNRAGYAAAIAVVLTVVIIAVSYFLILARGKPEENA